MKLDLDAIEKALEVTKEMGIESPHGEVILQFARDAKVVLEHIENNCSCDTPEHCCDKACEVLTKYFGGEG